MGSEMFIRDRLYGEMKDFFPNNAVEYFVSYYDYYQPEAYVPRSDTYIEKESSINDQIARMRHSATRALLERKDVIIVASVSCIYGIGSVETYSDSGVLSLHPNKKATISKYLISTPCVLSYMLLQNRESILPLFASKHLLPFGFPIEHQHVSLKR